MITFTEHGSRLVLTYLSSDGFGSADWVDEKLKVHDLVTLSRAFSVQKADLLGSHSNEDFDEGVRRFVIGSVNGDYRTIRKDVLGLKHDLLIATSVELRREIFVEERGISVFRRIDELIDEQIVVGGNRIGAIPEDEFAQLLKEFPTSTEL